MRQAMNRVSRKISAAPAADAIVREVRHAGEPPAGAREIFRDTRFIAWRLAVP